MNSMSGAADDLLATLTAAEACLRALAASAFPPDVMMRIERDSTRAARQAVASLQGGRTLELPVGWSEYVEVDEALDALLARLVPATPASDATLPRGVRPAAAAAADAARDAAYVRTTPAPTPAPPPFRQPTVQEITPPPRVVIGADPTPVAPPAAAHPAADLPDVTYIDDEEIDEIDALDALDDDDAAPPAAPPASRWDEEDDEDEEEATIIGTAEDRAAIQSGAHQAVTSDDAWVRYEPVNVVQVDPDELQDRKTSYRDDGVDYITYVEPTPTPYDQPTDDDEPLPAYASGPQPAIVDPEDEHEAEVSAKVPSPTKPKPAAKPAAVQATPASPPPAVKAAAPAKSEPLPSYLIQPDAQPAAPTRSAPPRPAPPRPRNPAPAASRPAADAASLPATDLPADDEWSFVASGQEEVEGPASHDPYAVMRKERMRLDDFTAVDEAEEAMLAAAERAVTAAVSGVDVDDDAPTAIRPADDRAHAAAIQLTGEGGSRILGLDEDEDDDDSVIELGDTRDYGEDDGVEDDQTGILGVGVVEYDDDVEDLDEDGAYEDDDPHVQAPLGPGAPELTPAEVSALIAKAEAVARRDMAEGVRVYSDVLDADPVRAEVLLARGRLNLDLGDFPAAVSDFLKAEGFAPDDADVLVALGDLFFNRKDYGKAVFYFNRALTVDDGHANAYARRGMAHYYRKQYNAAVEDLEKAKRLDGSLAMVDSYLARARKRG
ncbi:MAG: tetratricopeptide repeat protein [Alphaproteobacteria bacterium]|nr:tetratricopeptide repeat protein [Alphaproteobacteria bacterium]